MSEFISDRKDKLATFRKDVLKKETPNAPINIPEGLFVQCESCQTVVYQRTLNQNGSICPKCGFHFRINAQKRLELSVDSNSFLEIDKDLQSKNPLQMPDYEKKLAAGQELAGMNDAFLSGTAKIDGQNVAIGILDSTFMMGSMGSVVGEKVTRLIEKATSEQLPLILFAASGGARMQEGIFSLMQMAKTAGALALFHEAGLLYISVLTNPTTGGVAASFASLGDINIAEKSSLIGFAGPRVIKQTIRQELPEGFQTDEFQLKHGAVDLIVERKAMKAILAKLIRFHVKRGA